MSVAHYLPALVSEVAETFGAGDRVRVRAEVDDFTLETKVLSNLGIAVNELVTNAMKHAFPRDERGELVVSAWMEGESAIVSVTDTGPGFPPSFEAEASHGFGFTLVRAIADQLEGTVHIDRASESHGARVALTFPVGAQGD